jgi:aryl-alcohol dehydrogenase-like predicted oxidoreductase
MRQRAPTSGDWRLRYFAAHLKRHSGRKSHGFALANLTASTDLRPGISHHWKDSIVEQRTLGSQGLRTSAIGYGAMGISQAYGGGETEQGVAAIQRAYELGVTFFDTAEMYGWGENEKILGRAVMPFRDDVVVATKFGFVPPGYTPNSRPDHIREVVENSLRNLATDHIDVLYQHREDPDVPIEDVAGVVRELIEAGKVTYFGLCEVGEQTIRAAHAVQAVSVIQTEYSIFERDVEQLFPVLRELDIALVPYSPLGRGFLTGTARPAGEYEVGDIRNVYPQWQPGNFEHNVDATAKLSKLADAKGMTPAQLALAWLLAQGDTIVPIPGTRRAHRVDENVASVGVELSSADLARIAEILPDGAFGSRYPEAALPTWR